MATSYTFGAPVAPDPVRWVSYEVDKINIEWTPVAEAVTYQIQYTDMTGWTYDGEVLPLTTTTYSISCNKTSDGRKLFVQLRFRTLSDGTSPWSVPETVMCAFLPSPPQQAYTDMATQDLIILRWEPPGDNGGTPILGYKLYMRRAIEESWNLASPYYEGKEDPVTRLMYITTYNGAPLVQSETYHFMTKSRNWVGWSLDSQIFVVNIPYKVSPTNCIVTGNGLTPSDLNIDASVDATITVLAKFIDVDGYVRTKPLPLPAQNYEDIFFLHVLDRCAMPNGNYFCEETADSSNILKPPQMLKITYYD